MAGQIKGIDCKQGAKKEGGCGKGTDFSGDIKCLFGIASFDVGWKISTLK